MKISGTILDKIAGQVANRTANRKKILSLKELRDRVSSSKNSCPSFLKNFKINSRNIIAEIKFRSPSEGDLHKLVDPVQIAKAYIRAGAAAISVLTEEDNFGGSQKNLMAIGQSFNEIPLLLKDFVIDEYQIYEGVQNGAAAVLLVVALLEETVLKNFLSLTESLGAQALVEVHDQIEMKIALNCGAKLIGVNNRDLKTMKISLKTSELLAPMAPKDCVLISESGISSAGQMRDLATLGFSGFLIGSTLMKTADPGLALKNLMGDENES